MLSLGLPTVRRRSYSALRPGRVDRPRVLACISIAMGLCLLTPTRAARLFGLGSRPGLMTAIASRDLAIGLLLYFDLSRRATWLRLHAMANLVDGTGVGIALCLRRMPAGRGLGWLLLAIVGGTLAWRESRLIDA